MENIVKTLMQNGVRLGSKQAGLTERMDSGESIIHLEQNILDDVRDSMREMLGHIKDTGILDTYWHRIEKENKKAVRGIKEAERARKKLILGSECSYNTPLEELESDKQSDWSGELTEDLQQDQVILMQAQDLLSDKDQFDAKIEAQLSETSQVRPYQNSMGSMPQPSSPTPRSPASPGNQESYYSLDRQQTGVHRELPFNPLRFMALQMAAVVNERNKIKKIADQEKARLDKELRKQQNKMRKEQQKEKENITRSSAMSILSKVSLNSKSSKKTTFALKEIKKSDSSVNQQLKKKTETKLI